RHQPPLSFVPSPYTTLFRSTACSRPPPPTTRILTPPPPRGSGRGRALPRGFESGPTPAPTPAVHISGPLRAGRGRPGHRPALPASPPAPHRPPRPCGRSTGGVGSRHTAPLHTDTPCRSSPR